jgi:hypothetical protein
MTAIEIPALREGILEVLDNDAMLS